ncbi:hypothetical protein KP509_32G072100 [Ceratopteris richardii]|uniref:Retrotransposon Copia-like N-terminal domain-containing protein n=1 Tax=Ceratopteris richardii TaxID=49495 RepID=A0A8T2QW55_CERRI|nr:hypothetical protein KP509_32G072100 [Ceratopteris richardii]
MENGDGMTHFMSDKLDKNNFHAWRFRMMNFLMGKGYYKYIKGENENAPQLPKRIQTVDQLRAYEEWNQGAQKVMYWLSVSIQDSMIGYIQDAKTLKEACNNLVTFELHISNSKTSIQTRENILNFADLVSMLIIEEKNLGEDSNSQGKPSFE